MRGTVAKRIREAARKVSGPTTQVRHAITGQIRNRGYREKVLELKREYYAHRCGR